MNTLHTDLPDDFRSGFAALVGRPNVGKSTLLNCMVGEQLAITTHRAQTTRKRIRGIVHRNRSQIVLVDTPGLHLPKTSDLGGQPKKPAALNQYMDDEARSALMEVDVVIMLVEAQGRGRSPNASREDRMVLDLVRKTSATRLLAINKIDALKNKNELLPMMDVYHAMGIFHEIIPLSAKTGEGVAKLVEVIETYLPSGPRYFPVDMLTDEPERLLAAEYIREQVFLQSDQEVPYSTAVEILSFEEISDRRLVRIHAQIFVERQSQKGILIGQNGSRLKTIGIEARKSIERLLGCKVFLDLRVKHKKAWTKTRAGLRSVGYRDS